MIVRLKNGLIVITAESMEERETIAEWASQADGKVFALKLQDEQTVRLSSLGPRPEACREPINVTSRSPDPAIQLISNFAHTPFVLDGLFYASVEAFWQGLKFPAERSRREIALLHGATARRAGQNAVASATIDYRGHTVRVGTFEHWRLMALACWAKFSQHEAARQALLDTKERPLTHKTRHDSQTIPGVVMADIWMKIRLGLARRKGKFDEIEDETPEFEPDPKSDDCDAADSSL